MLVHENGRSLEFRVYSGTDSETRIGVIKDVTQRRKAEKFMRIMAIRDRVFLDSVPDIIFLKDEKFRYLISNKANNALLRLTNVDVIGHTDFDIMDENAAKACRASDEQVLREKRIIANEEVMDGHIYKTVKFPVLLAKGATGIGSFIHDITDEKRAQEERRLNEDRLKRLVAILEHPFSTIQEFLDFALEQAIQMTSSKIGYIYHYDEEKKLFTLNTWSKEVMPGCTVQNSQTIYELDKTGFWGEAVRQRGPIINNDFRASHPLKKGLPKGHVELKKFMTVPVLRNGEIVGVIGLANKENDYTEMDILQCTLLLESAWRVADRMRAEEELRSLNEHLDTLVQRRTAELSDANSALRSFSYSVSHDLRAPLRRIRGFMEMFMDEYAETLTDEGRKQMQRIMDNVDLMDDLIDDFLKLNKVSNSELSLEDVDISALAKMAYSSLKHEYQGRNVIFSVEPELHATGDSDLLSMVVKNLLENALKFSAVRECAHISVGRASATDDRGQAFFVKDDGIGFDPKHAGEIFNGFKRLNPVSEYPGSGIGLTIVRQVIQRHGGKVWAESAPGQGATFYFTVPETDPPRADSSIEAASRPKKESKEFHSSS